MGNKKYVVALTKDQRECLGRLIAAGQAPARKLMHARVLLKVDQGPDGPGLVDDEVAQMVEVSQPTISRLRQQFVEEGLEAALNRRAPRREYQRKLDGEQEARLVALACSAPPDGRVRWSLRLLADKLVELEVVDHVSYQTVGRTLKKTNSSPGSRSSGASHPKQAASSSGEWKTSSKSTPDPTIRTVPWSVWTR